MTVMWQERHNGRRGVPAVRPEGPLRAIQLIETVSEGEPSVIVPITQCSGSAVSAKEAMAARVKWANRARYVVLTRDVPERFAPYNAIIRVLDTEDFRADYLATLVDEGHDDDRAH